MHSSKLYESRMAVRHLASLQRCSFELCMLLQQTHNKSGCGIQPLTSEMIQSMQRLVPSNWTRRNQLASSLMTPLFDFSRFGTSLYPWIGTRPTLPSSYQKRSWKKAKMCQNASSWRQAEDIPEATDARCSRRKQLWGDALKHIIWVATIPQVVTSIVWGVLVFKEITRKPTPD